MNSDAYGHYQSFSKPDKPAKNVFSFAFASRPNASSENKLVSEDNNASNGTSFFPRGLKSNTKNPGFNQLHKEPSQSARIFPSNRFQTPQRVPKQEPTSPFGEHFQIITPSFNAKPVEHDPEFNHAKYQLQEGTHKRHYLPALSEVQRSGSLRAAPPLTPSNRSVTQSSESVDDDDLDLSDLMNRRMKEAKVVKSQLAEERVLTVNLRSQVASLRSDNSELEKRIVKLEAAKEKYNQDTAAKLDEFKQMQELLTATQAAQQSQQTIIDDKEKERLEQSEYITMLQKKVQENEERVAKVKDTAKRGIENLGRNYQAMLAAFEQLKHKQEHSRKNIENVKGEILDLKFTATERFKEIEPLLDPSGRHLFKSAETRGLVQELQNDRSDAQRVIDMLRDKLHVLGAQVVDYKEKVEILENMRKEEGVNFSKTVSLLEAASKKVDRLVEKLRQREQEGAERTAVGAKLELQLTHSEDRITKIQTELERKNVEIEGLNDSNRKLNIELQLTSARLDDALQRQAMESERLAAAQGQLRSQEQEIVLLRGNIERFENSEEGLRAASATSSARILELEDMVRSAHAAEAAAVAKCENLLEKSQVLELEVKKGKKKMEEKAEVLDARIEKMSLELNRSEEELRQANTRFVVLQERFDSQTTMLKFAKEQSGDLQERLLSSEKANAAKLEASEGNYKTEIAVLAEQRSTLQNEVEKLKAQLGNLETSSNEYKTHAEETLGNLKAANVILKEQKASLQVNFDRLQEDYAELRSQKADLQTEKRALQEMLEKGSEETWRLRNLVEKHDKEAALRHQNVLDRVDCQQVALAGVSADYKERLAKQEEYHSKLLQAENKRADVAEKSFEHVSTQVRDLKLEISTLDAELKATKDAAVIVQENLARARAVEDNMKDTLARIESLESENECLRRMESTIQERYQTGELSDSEKELVSLVMNTTQTMHEQEIVEKGNELRRRDNMNGALQAKIDALESTLAKCLKNQGPDQDGQSKSKSMVDLNIWMSSSPLSGADSLPPSQTRSSVIVSRRVISDHSGRVTSRPESPTFAQLEADEHRPSSEDKPQQEPARPTKKLRASAPRKMDTGDEAKPKRGNARKRRI
ncbi:hypothetical protein E1B28_003917 [Marasmius oreades]|uniref:Uncharacterized protein n=1 Tax=Marasmius oreades TaxID=181124 RepID=A0A9P7UXJ2_9AGAR|nr:uncharacterized protein E1B28_003917 [Marasmius oreades]KAG7096487.1 hypothetical protein E1B28_003917 [Marasmius oreades]